MNCRICKRELKNPEAIAKGIGHICAMKNQTVSSEIKQPIVKLAHRFADGSRSWAVLTSPARIVHISPLADGGRIAKCSCDVYQSGAKCEHITLAAAADAARFIHSIAA